MRICLKSDVAKQGGGDYICRLARQKETYKIGTSLSQFYQKEDPGIDIRRFWRLLQIKSVRSVVSNVRANIGDERSQGLGIYNLTLLIEKPIRDGTTPRGGAHRNAPGRFTNAATLLCAIFKAVLY